MIIQLLRRCFHKYVRRWGFENSNSCLWNLCSFGLVFSILIGSEDTSKLSSDFGLSLFEAGLIYYYYYFYQIFVFRFIPTDVFYFF